MAQDNQITLSSHRINYPPQLENKRDSMIEMYPRVIYWAGIKSHHCSETSLTITKSNMMRELNKILSTVASSSILMEAAKVSTNKKKCELNMEATGINSNTILADWRQEMGRICRHPIVTHHIQTINHKLLRTNITPNLRTKSSATTHSHRCFLLIARVVIQK